MTENEQLYQGAIADLAKATAVAVVCKMPDVGILDRLRDRVSNNALLVEAERADHIADAGQKVEVPDAERVPTRERDGLPGVRHRQ